MDERAYTVLGAGGAGSAVAHAALRRGAEDLVVAVMQAAGALALFTGLAPDRERMLRSFELVAT